MPNPAVALDDRWVFPGDPTIWLPIEHPVIEWAPGDVFFLFHLSHAPELKCIGWTGEERKRVSGQKDPSWTTCASRDKNELHACDAIPKKGFDEGMTRYTILVRAPLNHSVNPNRVSGAGAQLRDLGLKFFYFNPWIGWNGQEHEIRHSGALTEDFFTRLPFMGGQ